VNTSTGSLTNGLNRESTFDGFAEVAVVTGATDLAGDTGVDVGDEPELDGDVTVGTTDGVLLGGANDVAEACAAGFEPPAPHPANNTTATPAPRARRTLTLTTTCSPRFASP
jgi:hypothetical protein